MCNVAVRKKAPIVNQLTGKNKLEYRNICKHFVYGRTLRDRDVTCVTIINPAQPLCRITNLLFTQQLQAV